MTFSDLEVRRIEHDTHGQTTNGARNGNGHDPGEYEQTHSLPVHRAEATVAETDTDGGASDAHGGRDRQRELREHEHGDGSAQLHGGTCE